MSYCNAGHNWPVVVRRDGRREFLEKGGTILGIIEHLELEESSIDLAPGDVVVLYTDGISEAANAANEMFGDPRLCDCVAAVPRQLGARGVAEHVLADLRTFLGDVEPQDDITLLVLRVPEPVAAASPRDVVPEVAAVR
jgi:sigma-B regulation protein RsbU (phosphoserine phosphatase)